MGSGSTLKNIVTFGAYGQAKAQKKAAEIQEMAQMQAQKYQEQAFELQKQQMEQQQEYYNQQTLLQEREIASQAEQLEMANKENISSIKRQTTDKNTADLTKGYANNAPIVKAELKGEQEDLEQFERWY